MDKEALRETLRTLGAWGVIIIFILLVLYDQFVFGILGILLICSWIIISTKK